MRTSSIISRLTTVSTNVEGDVVTLNAPSIVKLNLERSEIASMARVNHDLVITLHSGEVITVKNFYVSTDGQTSQLVLEDEHGALWWVGDTEHAANFVEIASIDEILVAGSSHSAAGGAIWPWVLGGVAAVGAGVAIASGSGGGGHSDSSDNGGTQGKAPSTPTITSATGTVGTSTSTLPNNGWTASRKPGLSGTGEAGSTIHIKVDGTEIATVIVGKDGKWTLTLPSDLLDGSHTINVYATNGSGKSGDSGNFTLNIDGATPAAPGLDGIADNKAPNMGAITLGSQTNDTQPIISGTGKAGFTITLYQGTTVIGTAVVDSSGHWSIAPNKALSDGLHNDLTVTQTSKAGIEGGTLLIPAFTVDTLAPDQAIIATESVDGSQITGQAEKGSTVSIYDAQGKLLGTSTADINSGTFTITLHPAQTHGETLSAIVTDPAGNVSKPTTFPAADTKFPSQPIIVSVDDDTAPNIGPVSNGGYTNDKTPTIRGTAEAGSLVTIYVNGIAMPLQDPADPNGNWYYEFTTPLPDGDYVFTATANNGIGSSGDSLSYTVNVDTDLPGLNNLLLDSKGQVLTGTTEAGSTVTVKDSNGVTIGTGTADSKGAFTITLTTPQKNGETVTVLAEDKAGNIGPSTSFLAPDITPPGAPTGVTIASSGAVLTGFAEMGATITINDAKGNVIATGTANGPGGSFAIPLVPPLLNGEAVIVTASDHAPVPNVSAAASAIAPDITPPAIPDAVTVNTTGTAVSGHTDAGAIITVKDAGGATIGTGTADTSGQFTVTISPAQANGQTVSVTAADTAHNTSDPATAIAPDITAPNVPIITSVIDNVPEVVGPMQNGQTTNDPKPIITGTAEIDATIKIYDNGKPIAGTFTTDGKGGWIFAPSQPLDQGAHHLTITATDAAGNTSAASSFDLTVDTVSPLMPTITLVLDDVGSIIGPIADNGVTNDTLPTIRGTGEPGATIQLWDDTTLLKSDIVVSSSGTWSYTLTDALADASKHIFKVTSSDVNGNTTSFSNTWTINVDTQAPLAPTLNVTNNSIALLDGVATNVTSPTISGKGNAENDTVTVYDNGKLLGTGIVQSDGTWTITLKAPLGEGQHKLTAIESDPAGNPSPSTEFTLKIDTTAPDAPQILYADIEVNSTTTTQLVNGGLTKDQSPLLHGSAEPGSTITLYLNGQPFTTGTTITADAKTGAWSYEWPSSLPEGLNTITATSTDPAGNTSGISGVFSVNIDITKPIAVEPTITDSVSPIVGDITSGYTNDATPTFKGTGEVGSTIEITMKRVDELGNTLGTEKWTTTVGETGSWTYTPDVHQDGAYKISVIETDVAGNPSNPTSEISLTIDTQKPLAPAITLSVDPASIINGTSEPNAVINIYNGSNTAPIATTTANALGIWSITLTNPLPNGQYSLTATATDAAGNVSDASPPYSIDTIPLTIPVITAIMDDAGSISGPLDLKATQIVTDDTQLVITGTAKPGSTVILLDTNTLISTSVLVNPNGTWSITTAALSEGQHTFTATATMGGLPTAASNAIVVTVDTTPPTFIGTPAISTDGVTVSGFVSDSSLILNGITVTIKDAGGKVIGTGTTDALGHYSIQLTAAQTGGEQLSATAEDIAGNPSGSISFTGSSSGLPHLATIDQIYDDVANNIGPVLPGRSTNDTMPQLSGTTDIGSSVAVYIDSVKVGNATVDATGHWTYDITTPLTEASHTFAVQATNAVGTGAISAPITITVDLHAPDVPVIVNALNDIPGSLGSIQSGGLTNDARPTLVGTAEKNALITVSVDGKFLGTTTAAADGSWRFTPTSALDSTTHIFTATATDDAGNVQGSSLEYTITIDAIAPDAPTITLVQNDNGAPLVTIASGGATNDTRPLISGTAEKGSTVKIYDNGNLLATVTAGPDGSWSVPGTGLISTLSSGLHSLTATATDTAGNTSSLGQPYNITIDLQAPNAPTFTSVIDDVAGGIVGSLISGQLTNDSMPTLNGRAEAGATITIMDGLNPVQTLAPIIADNNGNWSYTFTTALSDGNHTLTVKATDPAGNTGPASLPFTVNVDATLPGAPSITNVTDLGNVAEGGFTNGTLPTISGTAEPGSTITIYNGSTLLGTTTASNTIPGAWSFTPSGALAPGSISITATATDAAGNTGAASTPRTFTIDTTAPNAPTLVSVYDDQSSIPGNLTSGALTRDTQPTFSGTTEANATVNLYDNGTLIGSMTTDSSGKWSITPTLPLGQGSHTFTLSAVDQAGNISVKTGGFNVVVDSIAPLKPVILQVLDDKDPVQGPVLNGQFTNDNTPTLSGTAEAGATVNIYDANGNQVGTTKADSLGAWSVTTSQLGEGTQTLNAVAVDAAGNVGLPSTGFTINIDTGKPNPPIIGLVVDAVGGGIFGNLASGQTTNDNRPVISGSAEKNSTVNIYDGTTLVATTTADSLGAWSVPTPLGEGLHTLTVKAVDAAGNISDASQSFTLTVDSVAPIQPVITNIMDDAPNIVGPVGNNQSTNDTTPTLNGTAEANSTVMIYNGGVHVTTVTANGSGNWTWTPTTPLPNGTYTFTVTATDAAGNVSAPSVAAGIIIDTVPPALVTGIAINTAGSRVTGVAEAGSTVIVTNSAGTTVLGTATADSLGNFTVTLSPTQTSGQSLLVYAQDKAGNNGGTAGVIAPDTRVPDAPIITSIYDNAPSYIGTITNGLTNDPQPTIYGTAQANATVSVYNNGVLMGTALANASGIWSYKPSVILTEGNHAFTATATNANGTGVTSNPVSVLVDTVAPIVTMGISADGGTLTGTAEANSTITVTLANNTKLTTTTNSSGAWSLTLPVRQIENQDIRASAVDAAGNTSDSVSIKAPLLALSASDNVASLDLTSTSTLSSQHYDAYGLQLVGALGNVASVLGSTIAQVNFSIAAGGSGDVKIDAAATGIVLTLLSSQNILIQRYDTSLGYWVTVVDSSNSSFANLLAITSSGVTLTMKALSEGSYRVLTWNSSLLATGTYTNLEVSVDQSSAGVLSGTTSTNGNVITDVDGTHGVDNAPTGTVVTTITDAKGVVQTVGANGIDVVGNYGTLHINQNGSYTYTLFNNATGSVVGHKESFTYTIAANGTSDSAHLVISLGPQPAASTVVAVDNSAAITYDTAVSYVDNNTPNQGGFSLIGVSLGKTLSLNVLANMTTPLSFHVQEGSTRVMSLTGSVGGVTVGTFDLYIYRFNAATQQYDQYKVISSWIPAFLGGKSNPTDIILPGGDYIFMLNGNGISVATGYSIAFNQDHTYGVDSLLATTSGNVLTNDVAPTGSIITFVNGTAISATGTTVIKGLYGTLTIDAKGNYTYNLTKGTGADSINTPENFIYTVKGPNGDTDSASLSISLTPKALNAIDDVSSAMLINTTQDTITYSSGALNTASSNASKTVGSSSTDFDVAANTSLTLSSISVKITSGLAIGTLGLTWSILSNGVAIQGLGGTISSVLNGNSYNLAIPQELGAGHYTLVITSNFTGSWLGSTISLTPTFNGTLTHLDTYNASSSVVTGNIYDGTDAAGALDQLSTVHTLLTISGNNNTSSASLDPAGIITQTTVQGLYGTLTFKIDGSYTYTLNSGIKVSSITSKETFTYTLNDQNGHTDSATLTINMNPQLTSSSQNDLITGSAYGDTLIYKVLAATNSGGNGADEWTNFSIAQGDKIDLHLLLSGWDHQASTLGSFIQVSTVGANTVISIDRDGAGSTFKPTTLITLDNVHTTLQELIDHNSIITG